MMLVGWKIHLRGVYSPPFGWCWNEQVHIVWTPIEPTSPGATPQNRCRLRRFRPCLLGHVPRIGRSTGQGPGDWPTGASRSGACRPYGEQAQIGRLSRCSDEHRPIYQLEDVGGPPLFNHTVTHLVRLELANEIESPQAGCKTLLLGPQRLGVPWRSHGEPRHRSVGVIGSVDMYRHT